MTPEAKVKQAVKKRLDELEAYHFWPVQMGIGSATLDCLGCYRGLFFAIETKAPGKVPTARQELTAIEMRLAGAIVMIIDSVEQARAISFSHSLKAE